MMDKKLFYQPPAECQYCGKFLYPEKNDAMFVVCKGGLPEDDPESYNLAYFCHKGECNARLKKEFRACGYQETGWVDLSTYYNPAGLIRMASWWMKELRQGEKMDDQVYEKITDLLRDGYLHLTRDFTPEEEEEFDSYMNGTKE